jgi:hypothetical protein
MMMKRTRKHLRAKFLGRLLVFFKEQLMQLKKLVKPHREV